MLHAEAAYGLGLHAEAEQSFHDAVRFAPCETCQAEYRGEWERITGGV